jgi:CRP-like cAMP-binding protein
MFDTLESDDDDSVAAFSLTNETVVDSIANQAASILSVYRSMRTQVDHFRKNVDEPREFVNKSSRRAGLKRRRENITDKGAESGQADEPPPPPKTDAVRQILLIALKEHFLFSTFDPEILDLLIDAMRCEVLPGGFILMREGDIGDKFYVLESGRMEILDADFQSVATLRHGSAFGELALMYDCPRTATIRASNPSILWVLGRKAFRKILEINLSSQTEQLLVFLDGVHVLETLSRRQKAKLADALIVQDFDDGQYVIRQGGEGDKFYIVKSGSVRITHSKHLGAPEKQINRLGCGEHFGEKALLTNEPRAANVIAEGSTECYVLEQV